MAAGIRASWTADSGCLAIDAEVPHDSSAFDVLVNDKLFARVSGHGRVRREIELGLLAPGSIVQLWLPQFGQVKVHEASLRGENVRALTETGKRWLTYGSSITQCQQADGPSEAWPALVARQYGWQLHSLGFAGECQLDPAAAETMKMLPAGLISLCIGINSYNAAAFSLRTYASQALGFIGNVRAAHRDVPIAVITPLLSLPREELPNSVGSTLGEYRRETANVVRLLRERGDHLIHCIDGGALLAEPEALTLLPDTLHPNNAGYRLMAERLGPQLAAIAGTAGIAANGGSRK